MARGHRRTSYGDTLLAQAMAAAQKADPTLDADQLSDQLSTAHSALICVMCAACGIRVDTPRQTEKQ